MWRVSRRVPRSRSVFPAISEARVLTTAPRRRRYHRPDAMELPRLVRCQSSHDGPVTMAGNSSSVAGVLRPSLHHQSLSMAVRSSVAANPLINRFKQHDSCCEHGPSRNAALLVFARCMDKVRALCTRLARRVQGSRIVCKFTESSSLSSPKVLLLVR